MKKDYGGKEMSNEFERNDWGLRKETYDLLCTLTKLGLKFQCPLQKLIKIHRKDSQVEAVDKAIYRRT